MAESEPPGSVPGKTADRDYQLGHDDAELERLNRQGRILAPATRIILEEAGLLPGMRVLDLGSGLGDVAFVAAELIGSTGEVVGIDRSTDTVAKANIRARQCGLGHVRFVVGDIHDLGPAGPFDAIIGRLVLMYLSDPAAVLRTQATLLGPGGLVIPIEFDVHTARSIPSTPLVDQAGAWIAETFTRSGIATSLGPRLWAVLREAGLQPFGMIAVQPHFGPDDPDGPAIVAGIVRTILPLIERTGVATAEQVGAETLEQRLSGEFRDAAAVFAHPTLFGAWAAVDRTCRMAESVRSATGTGKGPDANAVYALGSNRAESARLQRQAEELAVDSAALLDRVGLRPGQSAIDLGCGPRGILDLLAERVSPAGRVVGVDADPAHTAMAAEFAAGRGLRGVEVITADARRTGLPSGSFDLIHARTLLINIPDPAEVTAEMARLVRPGGWVVSTEPDTEHDLCYPPHPAFERLCEIFPAAFSRNGADPRIGRRVPELLRQAGLEDVGVEARVQMYPPGNSRRTIRLDLIRSMRPQIVEMGLAGEAELDELDAAARAHLDDPRTVAMSGLLFLSWGRRPA